MGMIASCRALSQKLSFERCCLRSLTVTLFLISFFAPRTEAIPPVPYPLSFDAGTPSEQLYLLKSVGSTLQDGTRHAEPNQFWVYGIPALAGTRLRLRLKLVGEIVDQPAITVNGLDNKPLPMRLEREGTDGLVVIFTIPDKWLPGNRFPVIIGARNSAISVQSVQVEAELPDVNGDGLPDPIAHLMTEGLPVGIRPVVYRAPAQPYTATLSSQALAPECEPMTDALFSTVSTPATFDAWKQRGYLVWAQPNAQENSAYATQHPDEWQTGADGKPIFLFGAPLLFPTEMRLDNERTFVEEALNGGADGLNLVELGFAQTGGYGQRFQRAWEAQFHQKWIAPTSSPDSRFRAGQLMASLEINRMTALLQKAQDKKPLARRIVSLYSPLFDTAASLVSPVGRIAALPDVQEIVGQVDLNTTQMPLRYAGLRSERAFDAAYLEYSALTQLTRGLNKRLWFSINPAESDVTHTAAEHKARFADLLTAALLFPDVDAFVWMPGWDALLAHTSSEELSLAFSLLALLQDLHNQSDERGGNAEIGVLLGEGAQWQQDGLHSSGMDGFYGLTLPQLQRGIPVQVVSLDRVVDPGYLNGFKTLLLSYDFQKPLGARTQSALADWVRRGGSLLFFGGSDPMNEAESSWWRQANLLTPQADLWAQLGLSPGARTITREAQTEDLSHYRVVAQGSPGDPTRRPVTLDLSALVQQTGSVAVRFASITPMSMEGPSLASAELRVNGQVAASFTAGSEIENRFLLSDAGSQFDGNARYVTGDGAWSYQFDNLPRSGKITLTLEIGNGYRISVAPATPDFSRTLVSTKQAGPIAIRYPRLRVGAAYPITLYPELPLPKNEASSETVNSRGRNSSLSEGSDWIPLYTLRGDGVAIWARAAGRGLVINAGVASGFFAASERSAGLLRRLVQYAQQRAGGVYREPGFLRVRRGRYLVIHTFGESETVEGRTIDILSPDLSIAEDRVIPPHTSAVLLDAGRSDDPPHLLFAAGRLQAKIETGSVSSIFIRGTRNTTGIARFQRGNHRLTGARAVDCWGRSLPVQATEEGSTLLLRFSNQPDGVIVRLGWD